MKAQKCARSRGCSWNDETYSWVATYAHFKGLKWPKPTVVLRTAALRSTMKSRGVGPIKRMGLLIGRWHQLFGRAGYGRIGRPNTWTRGLDGYNGSEVDTEGRVSGGEYPRGYRSHISEERCCSRNMWEHRVAILIAGRQHCCSEPLVI